MATATKALQDQLAGKDLPFLQRHLRHPFEWALLKGRSNYLCMQRLDEMLSAAARTRAQLALDGVAERAPAEELLPPRRLGRDHRDRRPGRARRGALRAGVERAERVGPGVPGRGALPERRGVLRRGGPPPRPGGRRRRGEPPPLRARPRHGRRAAPRPRAGDHRRGPPARGHRVGHQRHRAHRRPLHRPGPPHPRRHRRRPAAGGRRRRRTPPHRGAPPASRHDGCAAACPTTWPASIDGRQGPGGAGAGGRPQRARRRARGHPHEGRAAGAVERRARSTTWPASSGSARTRWCGWRAPTPTRCSASRRSTCRGCSRSGSGTSAPPSSPAPRSPPSCPLASASPTAQITELDVGSPFDYEDARAPLLRRPPARPAQPRLRRGAHRRARRPDRGGRRPHARAVHELPGARRGRRRPPAPLRRGPADPHPARPPQGEAARAVHRRRGHQPVRHHGLLAGRRRARAARSAWSPSTASRSRAPTSRSSRPGASGPAPRPSASSTSPAPPPSSPRAPVASSAPPPTAASSPSSTPASPRPATAGTSSTPCHRCGGPRTATKPAAPSSRSADERADQRDTAPIDASPSHRGFVPVVEVGTRHEAFACPPDRCFVGSVAASSHRACDGHGGSRHDPIRPSSGVDLRPCPRPR